MARRPRVETAASFAPEVSTRPGAKVFAEIAAKSSSFRQARQTLRRVRAVPTIFPYVDWKLQVGGWPTERVGVVHGPSAAGKTMFCHGLGLSFLKRGHMYCLIDSEFTTPIPWLETLLGPYADDAAFLASRPKSFEQAVNDVRKIVDGLIAARAAKKVPEDTTCLFVVDSIRKLVPEDIQAKIKRYGAEGEKGSVDGMSGAAGRMRAAMNSAWLDDVVPLMYHGNCAIIFVGREAEDPNADANDRKFGNDWKLTGGKALFFDSSLVVRVSHAGFVYAGKASADDDEETKKKKAVVLGERHLVEVHKTKVAARQDRVERAWFYTSNGKTTPEGFDRARELLALGEALGVVKKSGAWLAFGGKRYQGEAKFFERADTQMLDGLEAACRAKFGQDAAKRADVVGS